MLFIADWSHWTSLEARGGHEEDVRLLLEAGAALEWPCTAPELRRSNVIAAGCHDTIPHRVLPQVRTSSTPVSFCPKNPTSPCPGELGSRALMSPLWHHYAGPMHHPCWPVRREQPAQRCRAKIRSPIPFHLNKILAARIKSTVEIDLLCHRLISRNCGPGPRDRGHIRWDFIQKIIW
jgi:hypothetical protein